jgi:hypothetical protein
MDQLRRRLAEQQVMQAQAEQARGGVAAQPMPQQQALPMQAQALPMQAQALAQHQQQLGYGQPAASPYVAQQQGQLAAAQAQHAQMGQMGPFAPHPVQQAQALQQQQVVRQQALAQRRRGLYARRF